MNNFVNGGVAANQIDADAPCCFNCRHGFLQRLPPPNLGSVRVCKLLPPAPLAMRDMRNQITGFASASPIVTDNDFCAHFEKRHGDVAKSQAANEDTGNAPGRPIIG